MTRTKTLHQEAIAARARAVGLGQKDTAHVLAGIAAMIAALEAEDGIGESASPSPRPHDTWPG